MEVAHSCTDLDMYYVDESLACVNVCEYSREFVLPFPTRLTPQVP